MEILNIGVPLILALLFAGVAALLLQNEGRPRYMVMLVLILGFAQAGWGWFSDNQSTQDSLRMEGSLTEAVQARTALSASLQQQRADIEQLNNLLSFAEAENKKAAERVDELRSLLASAEASRDRIGIQLDEQSERYDRDISRVHSQLDTAQERATLQSETINELNNLVAELSSQNASLSADVARLNSGISSQNSVLNQTRNLAAESARRLEAEEANRIRCQAFLGDANFRRTNGC